MNPKQFLIVGGAVLLLVGILGFDFVGIIGPTPEKSIFGDAWWFDDGENWAHTILGVAGLIAGFAFPASAQRGLVFLLGIVGIFFGVYSIVTQEFLGTNLENPADTLLHLAVGGWALFAATYGRTAARPMA